MSHGGTGGDAHAWKRRGIPFSVPGTSSTSDRAWRCCIGRIHVGVFDPWHIKLPLRRTTVRIWIHPASDVYFAVEGGTTRGCLACVLYTVGPSSWQFPAGLKEPSCPHQSHAVHPMEPSAAMAVPPLPPLLVDQPPSAAHSSLPPFLPQPLRRDGHRLSVPGRPSQPRIIAHFIKLPAERLSSPVLLSSTPCLLGRMHHTSCLTQVTHQPFLLQLLRPAPICCPKRRPRPHPLRPRGQHWQ